MSRPLRARALVPLMLVAAGCQDYNFNPVGHCLVQPGTERFTLSDVSSADVLFVVDDSGSMAAEQQKLARNFDRFIKNLNDTNLARAANGLEPIDFHVAVTTTSVFWNYEKGTCSSTCTGASGKLVCCQNGSPVVVPRTCSGASDTSCPAGTACSAACGSFKGEYRCCNADHSMNLQATEPLACGTLGAACGSLEHHVDCADPARAGVSENGYAYARGDFVSWADATKGLANPRVLHFDKQLYPAAQRCTTAGDCGAGQACVAGVCRASCSATTPCVDTDTAKFACVAGACQPRNAQGFTSDQLVSFFVGDTTVSGNVIVGTCGSAQEQALQAARLAVQKALASQQKDTYDLTGQARWTAWNAGDRSVSPSASAAWPHDKAKLALVFIGDEDDCSSPDDSANGVIMRAAELTPGADSCVADAKSATPKQYQIQEIADYFASLGRPLGAAFIASAQQTVCGREPTSSTTDQQQLAVCGASSAAIACTPGVCLQYDCPAGQCTSTDGFASTPYCGGQAGGYRLFSAANALRAKGADVVEGSVCDANFGEILNQVAEIVKPPSGLVLPTMPADGQITLLRIAQANGETRALCKGPAPATSAGGDPMTAAMAAAAGYDWWFTATRDGSGDPVRVSQFVFINHGTNHCEANPGETYSADYVAQQPAGGCAARTDCSNALGGRSSDWGCYKAPDAQRGTCICCGAGSTDQACEASAP